jgi:hypothetical protein
MKGDTLTLTASSTRELRGTKGYANLIYTYSLGLPSLYSLDVAVGSCLTQQEIGSPSI